MAREWRWQIEYSITVPDKDDPAEQRAFYDLLKRWWDEEYPMESILEAYNKWDAENEGCTWFEWAEQEMVTWLKSKYGGGDYTELVDIVDDEDLDLHDPQATLPDSWGRIIDIAPKEN